MHSMMTRKGDGKVSTVVYDISSTSFHLAGEVLEGHWVSPCFEIAHVQSADFFFLWCPI